MRSIVELFRGDSERGFIARVVYEPLNQFLGLPRRECDLLIYLTVYQPRGCLLLRDRPFSDPRQAQRERLTARYSVTA